VDAPPREQRRESDGTREVHSDLMDSLAEDEIDDLASVVLMLPPALRAHMEDVLTDPPEERANGSELCTASPRRGIGRSV
jgi:hypothetical protein